MCEKAAGPARTCDFRSGKIILQQEIPREQMVKLLATGKTDLFTQFISKKNRPFKAFLIKKPDGNIGFEFMARKEPAKAASKTAAKGKEVEGVEEEQAEYAVAAAAKKAPAKKAAAKNAANDPAPVKAVAKKAAVKKTAAKAPAKKAAVKKAAKKAA
jgi:DNA topoisomerase-3